MVCIVQTGQWDVNPMYQPPYLTTACKSRPALFDRGGVSILC